MVPDVFLRCHPAPLSFGSPGLMPPPGQAGRLFSQPERPGYGTDASRVLLRAGAEVNLADKDGMTALHLAMDKGNDSVVDLLPANGAIITASSKKGFSWRYR